ncbi:hypothetical protein EDB19DRAFT_1576764, partial [Suillus lakei]
QDIPWANPSTLDEWKKDPSRKLDILVEVVQWHKERDNRQPLCIVDDKLEPSSSNPDIVAGIADPTLCDKFVVYCAFPTSYFQVTKVSDDHYLLFWKFNDNRYHCKIQNSGRDGPRVLIISNVGLTGLNLPCANILIIVDSLWSATDEGQLIGRIYRPPQQRLSIYRIIAANTQDVFLNNISFSKAAILDAFTLSNSKFTLRNQ